MYARWPKRLSEGSGCKEDGHGMASRRPRGLAPGAGEALPQHLARGAPSSPATPLARPAVRALGLGLDLLLGVVVGHGDEKRVLVPTLRVRLELVAVRCHRRLSEIFLEELVHLHGGLVGAGRRRLSAD